MSIWSKVFIANIIFRNIQFMSSNESILQLFSIFRYAIKYYSADFLIETKKHS